MNDREAWLTIKPCKLDICDRKKCASHDCAQYQHWFKQKPKRKEEAEQVKTD